MKSKLRTVVIWVAALGLVIVLYNLLSDDPVPLADYSRFTQDLEAQQVALVEVGPDQFLVTLHSQYSYAVAGPIYPEQEAKLFEKDIPLEWLQESQPWVASYFLPLLLVLAVVAFLLHYVRKSDGVKNVLTLRHSTARLIPETAVATFADVGGCEVAKEQLTDVVHFLNDPKPWIRASARLPRGVLLEGPPGCGKTLLARAVAGETEAKFFLVSASEFVEMFVGVGAARVRDTFQKASKEAPAVIFIDELDAVGRRRGSGIGWGNDEREQTLNQLLVCLDGLEPNQRVVVIAATNRPDILDKALLRKGRFDRRIRIGEMSREDRIEILSIHTRDKTLADEVSLEALADQSPGFYGADLESMVNEAALLAVRRSNQTGTPVVLSGEDFEAALAQVREADQQFSQVDSVLIESASQLAQPAGQARVRLKLEGKADLEGEVVWADAGFLKIRPARDRVEILVPKSQILSIETWDGTERANLEEVPPSRQSGTARG